jgi:hypothetical protein
MRAAIYARVSPNNGQDPQMQIPSCGSIASAEVGRSRASTLMLAYPVRKSGGRSCLGPERLGLDSTKANLSDVKSSPLYALVNRVPARPL